jgi:hypothetical protein
MSEAFRWMRISDFNPQNHYSALAFASRFILDISDASDHELWLIKPTGEVTVYDGKNLPLYYE